MLQILMLQIQMLQISVRERRASHLVRGRFGRCRDLGYTGGLAVIPREETVADETRPGEEERDPHRDRGRTILAQSVGTILMALVHVAAADHSGLRPVSTAT